MNERTTIDGAEHVHGLLSDYLNNSLDDAERQRVQAHLETCRECRRDYESLRQTVQILRQVPRQPVPRSFTLPAPEPARPPRLFWLRLSTSALAAVFVALLAVRLVLPTAARPNEAFSKAGPAVHIMSAPSQSQAAPTAAVAASAASSAAPAASSAAPAATPAIHPMAAARAAPPPTPTPAVSTSGGLASTASEPPAPARETSQAASRAVPVAPASGPSLGAQPAAVSGRASTRQPYGPATPRSSLPDWYNALLAAVGILLAASLGALIAVSRRPS